jgi:hypothetical protein
MSCLLSATKERHSERRAVSGGKLEQGERLIEPMNGRGINDKNNGVRIVKIGIPQRTQFSTTAQIPTNQLTTVAAVIEVSSRLGIENRE